MKLVYFGVLSAIQPSPALKNMNFDIKQTTKTKHIETKYRNTQKRFQPDDSGTKKLELLTASASVACFCTLYWLSLICLARLAKVDDYLKNISNRLWFISVNHSIFFWLNGRPTTYCRLSGRLVNTTSFFKCR